MAGTGLVIPAGAIAAGEALAPLTCGELVQGTLGGRHFLVSCPIDVYTRAEVSLYRAGPDVSRTAAALLPPLPPGAGAKASRAVQLTLASLGKEDIQARVRLTRFFPPGKGLGTSTADILATAQATAQALGCRLTPSELARIALAIEPSDSTMFPGLALFDHRQGCTARILGKPPPLAVILFDLGGEVDTEEFNRRPDLAAANRAKAPLVRKALCLLWRGIRRQDPRLVAQAATMSALAHQSVLPKPRLEHLADRVCEMGALGVVNAHSGTVVGVLLPPVVPLVRQLRDRLAAWPGLTFLAEARVSGGGVKICPMEAASGHGPRPWGRPPKMSSTSALTSTPSAHPSP